MKNADSATVLTGDNKRAPASVAGVLVGVRLPVNLLEAIDEWIGDDDISRPEAIRQIIEFALIPKPGSLSISSELGAAINDWEPSLSLPDAIGRLVELGLKAKGNSA